MRGRSRRFARAIDPATNARTSRRQRGFGLIGAVVAVAVLSVLMGTVATRMLHDMRVRQGEILGHGMARLNAAVVDFTRRYSEQIRSAATDTPLPRPLQPATSQEKIATRLLDRLAGSREELPPHRFRLTLRGNDLRDLVRSISAAGIHIRPPMPKGDYVVHLDVHGGNCGSRRTDTCAVDSALYIDKPITRGTDVVDHLKLAAALRQLGAGGGMSLPGTPEVITFSSASRIHENAPYGNPVKHQPAGILLVDNFRRVDHLPFLRTDGGRMGGDIHMGGKNIVDVHSVQTKKLEADESLTVGTLNRGVTADREGIRVRGTIVSSASIDARSVKARDTISTDGKLILGAIANERGTCEPDRALSMDSTDKLLQCRHGYWEAVQKEPDVRVIAKEVRLIQQLEDSRIERRKMVVKVGPRYFLQNNFSTAEVEGEWDTCEIQYVVHLQKFRLLSEPGTVHKKWWVNGQAMPVELGSNWGDAHLKCERRLPG